MNKPNVINTMTILSHWNFDKEQDKEKIIGLALSDYALKCATLLNEYVDPFENNLTLSTGIYKLINQRWGIKGWIDKGYKKIGYCASEEDRIKYRLYDRVAYYLSKIHINEYDTIEVKENFQHVFGGGEIPFINIYEYRNKDCNKYEYVYTISR